MNSGSRFDGPAFALLIATDSYKDLPDLRSPVSDAREFAAVLADPAIGGYEVQSLFNEQAYRVSEGIEAFLANRHPEDTLILYLSCHGVMDVAGLLHFATANTTLNLLTSTTVSADFVHGLVINNCRAGHVLVLLDCCYSGAYLKGHRPRSVARVQIASMLDRGRAVITSSSSVQLSFEIDTGLVTGKPVVSPFTSAVIKGLRTGEADLDGDGLVSVDDLYNYVYDQVHDTTSQQDPEKKYVDARGDFFVARNPNPPAPPATREQNHGWPPRRRSRPRAVLVTALVASLVLTGIIVAKALSSPLRPKAHQSVHAAFVDLPDQRYASGLLVKRKWRLSGPRGSEFTETASANNVTGRRLQVILVEPIPPAIAGNLDTVHFSPVPAWEISESTHTVEFVLGVPASGYESFGYQVKVAPTGAHATRFTPWRTAFAAMNKHLSTNPAPPLKTLTIRPQSVQISVGSTEQLTVTGTIDTVTGTIHKDRPAPKALLSPVVWTSNDPNVATVSTAGVVKGISAGQSEVEARVGTRMARIYVTVNSSTTNPPPPTHTNPPPPTHTKTSTATPVFQGKIRAVFPSPAPNRSPEVSLADSQLRQRQAAVMGTAGPGALWPLMGLVGAFCLAMMTTAAWPLYRRRSRSRRRSAAGPQDGSTDLLEDR